MQNLWLNVMNNTFIDNLKKEIEKGLPGEHSHQRMLPVNRPLSSYALQKASSVRESAVAIIIYFENNTFKSILIQRPIYVGAHSGQISFPGGKKEVDDIHLEYTARRETFEEVGISIHQGELIGQLTSVFIPVSGFIIEPYLYFHTEKPQLLANEREVAEIIDFHLDDLIHESSFTSMSVEFETGLIHNDVPCFQLSAKNIWGATALILNELRDILVRQP